MEELLTIWRHVPRPRPRWLSLDPSLSGALPPLLDDSCKKAKAQIADLDLSDDEVGILELDEINDGAAIQDYLEKKTSTFSVHKRRGGFADGHLPRPANSSVGLAQGRIRRW